MNEKYQDRYRIPSARAAWWDYGWEGPYFVTICTHGRVHWFGQVVDGQMQLSPEGQQARAIWEMIPQQFDYAWLGPSVIMPNHVHGVVGISSRRDAINRVSTGDNRVSTGDSDHRVSATGTGEQGPPGGITGPHNPMLHDNLSRIIRWYKGRSTFECRKFNPAFRWQARFWDRIIRDQAEFERIAHYIDTNPANWAQDDYYEQYP